MNNTDLINDTNSCAGCIINPGIPGGPISPFVSNVNIPDPCAGQTIGSNTTNVFIGSTNNGQTISEICDPFVQVPTFPTVPNNPATPIIPNNTGIIPGLSLIHISEPTRPY